VVPGPDAEVGGEQPREEHELRRQPDHDADAEERRPGGGGGGRVLRHGGPSTTRPMGRLRPIAFRARPVASTSVVGVIAVVVAAAAYGAGVRRLARRGRRWPAARSLAFA